MGADQFVDALIGHTRPIYALLEEIEAAGTRVECFPGKTSPHTGNGGNHATADWHHKEQVWRIYHPVSCHAHQVYHELLHVHRYCLEKAPFLVAKAGVDAGTTSNLSELNNDFDHAHVVPREVRAYPEAGDYWSRDFSRKFPVIPKSTEGSLAMFQAKLELLRGWLVLPVAIPQSAVTQRYRDALQANDWLSAAERMTQQVQAAGPDKSDAVRAFREALGINFPAIDLCSYQ